MRHLGIKFNRILTCCLLIWLSNSSASSEAVYTPKPGSKERQAILDTLRVPVQKELQQEVIFHLHQLRVLNDWAFVQGIPRQANNQAIDYKKTRYAQAVREGIFDDGIYALLRREKGQWRVMTYVIGATDVPWVEWDQSFKAPRKLLPAP